MSGMSITYDLHDAAVAYWPSLVCAILSRLPRTTRSWEDSSALYGDGTAGFHGRRRHAKWEVEALQRADAARELANLPRFHRMVLVNHFIDKESHGHIATILRTDRDSVDQAIQDGVEAISYALGWRDTEYWIDVEVRAKRYSNGVDSTRTAIPTAPLTPRNPTRAPKSGRRHVDFSWT
jgi:hypothetical protein